MKVRGQDAIAQTPPAYADERNSEGDADDGAGRELVRHRAMRRQVDVPALVIVTHQLRQDRELQEEGVDLGGRLLVVAGRGGVEDRVELVPQVSEHGKIAPGDGASQAVTEGACACVSRAERVRLAGSLDCRVGKANRQLRVRREIHLRSLRSLPARSNQVAASRKEYGTVTIGHAGVLIT